MRKLLVLLLLLALPLMAQDKRKQAFDLFESNQFAQALPLLEELAAAEPQDGEVQLKLGFCLLVGSRSLKDPESLKRQRRRAREALEAARRLGIRDSLLTSALATMEADRGDEPFYSENKRANEVMVRAEAAFAEGRYPEARSAYAQALELDPRLYEAALRTAECYRREGEANQELAWYDRAIAINPHGERAYRFRGDALMRAGMFDEALDWYVEGYLRQPFGPESRDGLIAYARERGLTLSHPPVSIPTNVEGNTIELASDASPAWLGYSMSRVLWRDGKWALLYPGEPYRRSLQEEADSLRAALAIAAESGEKPDASLAVLQKLEAAGLLEAYIVLGMAGEGIVDDYALYYRSNKKLLERYVREVVLQGGRL